MCGNSHFLRGLRNSTGRIDQFTKPVSLNCGDSVTCGESMCRFRNPNGLDTARWTAHQPTEEWAGPFRPGRPGRRPPSGGRRPGPRSPCPSDRSSGHRRPPGRGRTGRPSRARPAHAVRGPHVRRRQPSALHATVDRVGEHLGGVRLHERRGVVEDVVEEAVIPLELQARVEELPDVARDPVRSLFIVSGSARITRVIPAAAQPLPTPHSSFRSKRCRSSSHMW